MFDSLRPPRTAAHQASLSITNSWSLLKLMSIESVMPSSHLIHCRPLLLLPQIPPSIRVFSNESTLLMRWPDLSCFYILAIVNIAAMNIVVQVSFELLFSLGRVYISSSGIVQSYGSPIFNSLRNLHAVSKVMYKGFLFSTY